MPNEADYYRGAAESRAAAGEPAAGLDILKRGLEEPDLRKELLLPAGLFAERAGETTLAIRLLEERAALDPSLPEVHLHLGRLLIESGEDVARGRSEVRRAVDLKPALKTDSRVRRLLRSPASSSPAQSG